MTSNYSEDTLPEPAHPNVKIRKIEKKLTASVTFSGYVSKSKIRSYEKVPLAWISRKNMKPSGNFRVARYNPPFIPPIFRKNEILIDVIRLRRLACLFVNIL